MWKTFSQKLEIFFIPSNAFYSFWFSYNSISKCRVGLVIVGLVNATQFRVGGGQEPSVTTIELTLQNSVTHGDGGPANLNFNAT